ncbi:polysaccharide deacetylase family protein [Aurantimonas endophytica]|uniref:Chitooligosaccharide deacetylase n=1 Tax=Aurantimonas endophytica TaxID=1522175 RepID=A0A7W6HBM3_9HYPH|nr:polysaccharide deacetylase family protein [Aurantimonas endophytica]MBB4002166.1 peptidoglycan/xylan/chitin deacetylase (PgdA/CDA1 family) [Aurantimonas endophytica]MCO6402205.1 polysaccharide deacetylase family protein [Aurantimonas endophytica]
MKNITLSFDNGPDPEVTPQVLDILATHGIKATFFVVGDKLRDPARYELSRRAKVEGHWIGNHTFNHLVPLGLSRHRAASAFEIGRTQELLGDLAGDRKLFRPFGGGGHINNALLDGEAVEQLREGRFTCVLWNVVPRDWEIPGEWPDEAMRLCAKEDWPLVVLHDLTTGAMDQLESFIIEAKASSMNFMQEFPEDCLPIIDGEVRGSISHIVSASAPKHAREEPHV